MTNNTTFVLLAERRAARRQDPLPAPDPVRPAPSRLGRALSAALREFRRQPSLPRVPRTGVDPVTSRSS